jgi:glutaredoxin
MNIIIYTKTGCPWCKGVLDFLNEKKIPYEERNVLIDPRYMDELIKKSAQTKTPTLDINGAIIADSDKDQVEAYFKEKGVLPKD